MQRPTARAIAALDSTDAAPSSGQPDGRARSAASIQPRAPSSRPQLNCVHALAMPRVGQDHRCRQRVEPAVDRLMHALLDEHAPARRDQRGRLGRVTRGGGGRDGLRDMPLVPVPGRGPAVQAPDELRLAALDLAPQQLSE